MILVLQSTGVLLMLLGLAHAAFPRHFRWREETKSLTLLTRQILYIHTAFIGLTVFLTGLLCATCAADLVSTPLGQRICLGLAVFWGARLVVQFIGYSSDLWRGKPFETVIHILFCLFWAYLSVLFSLAAWY